MTEEVFEKRYAMCIDRSSNFTNVKQMNIEGK